MPKLLVIGAIAAFALYMVGGARAAELAYGENTAFTSTTSTACGTGTTIVTAPSFTADGTTKYRIEFFTPELRSPGGGGGETSVYLFLDGSQLGRLAVVNGVASKQPASAARLHTPSAGSRTYSARLCVDSGTGYAFGGDGAAGNPMPAYIRVTSESAGGGASALGDLTDVDLTGYGDGDVLKYSTADTAWIAGTDLLGEGGGGGGEVTLSAGDRERLDLAWWGVWALVGLALLALIAPAMYRLLDVRHGMGGRFERG